MPWPAPVTMATRSCSLFFIGESIVAPFIKERRDGQASAQGTLRCGPEDPARSTRRAVRRQGDGGSRRFQPGIRRAAQYLLLERHLEPPGPVAQDALHPEPRHAHGARQGARAQAAPARRVEQRPHQGRDQGSADADGDLLRRARSRGGIPLRERGLRIERIAFIGLGTMGEPMAANLAAAGFLVQSYDARRKGSHRSVGEAAQGADVLITMLPDGEVVREVVLEALLQLKPDALVIDMSSCDPASSRALGRALAVHGIAMIDAPVSGAIAGAKDATLAIMVGGAAADIERARPVLEKLGSHIFHVGPLGAGHAVKALNNYLGAAGTIAGFEALLIARAFGLEPEPMIDAINASTGKNYTTERKIPRQILTGAFASGFKLALMAKDVSIAADLPRVLGGPAPS